ncbi:MAG: hypothetical protein DI591_01855 [Citromicrobium sp.]|nr:MAG: hypothetical protein DI591_01855 [Citromicrobium sp.]
MCVTVGRRLRELSLPHAALSGTNWTLVSLNGQPVIDQTAHIRFDTARLAASACCNQTGAALRADGGRLVIGPVAATRMYCDGKMDAEQQLGRLLESEPAYTVNGAALILDGGAVRAEFRRAG